MTNRRFLQSDLNFPSSSFPKKVVFKQIFMSSSFLFRVAFHHSITVPFLCAQKSAQRRFAHHVFLSFSNLYAKADGRFSNDFCTSAVGCTVVRVQSCLNIGSRTIACKSPVLRVL